MNSARSLLMALLLVTACWGQAEEDGPPNLQYVTDLEEALKIAGQTQKKVLLYAGTAHHLQGLSPRAFLLENFVQPSETVRAKLADWIVCERFVMVPMMTPGKNFTPAFTRELKAWYSALSDRYGLRFFYPTITLLTADGQKIAGPFTASDLGPLERQLDPPATFTAKELAGEKETAFYTAKGLDDPKPEGAKTIAFVPFMTVTGYAYVGDEHQFVVNQIAPDLFPDQGRFHAAILYASGRLTPPLQPGSVMALKVGDVFYKVTTDSLPLDTDLKGIGKLLMSPGEDIISITVDKAEQLEQLTRALEKLKAPPGEALQPR